MDVKVVLRPLAESDLQNIVEYIARDNPRAAYRLGQKLLDLAHDLSFHPQLGRPVRSRPGARKIGYAPYMIFYRFDPITGLVEILRFWHGARDPNSLKLE